jgi:phage gp16-like protein
VAKTLPQITLTDAQYARVAKIIPGKTAQEKVAAYEAMVKDMLRDLVIADDIQTAREAANVLIREAEAAARDNADNL